MKHAGRSALAELEDLLVELRGISGWTESKPGIFTIRRRSMLHFHEDPTGFFADLRETEDFVRLRVSTAQEKKKLIKRAKLMVANKCDPRG